VRKLSDKVALYAHAEALGMRSVLPKRYASTASAAYPCVLKAAHGAYGEGTDIVHSAAEVRRLSPGGLGGEYLLQELVVGAQECATSLVVADGRIIDCICTTYEYAITIRTGELTTAEPCGC
jgi:carbamoylphosphate synthase large subunit